MKFAIIAAGEGSRLAQEGVALPKPLVRLWGEAMIDRLLRIFYECEAEEVVVIVNQLHPQTEEHLRELAKGDYKGRLRLVVKTTPSSMHSFAELAPYLEGAPFCLTTVDTIFREEEFKAYIREFLADDCDGLMAVTDFIDDEKPLYVGTDASLGVTGFFDERPDDCRYISGGIYALRPAALQTLRRCMAEGQSRMRNFQRGLIADGLRIKARPFSKILDVDHAEDIDKAEAFLDGEEAQFRVLGVSRSTKFSPQSEARDRAIFDAVCERLRMARCIVNTASEESVAKGMHLSGYSYIFSMARSREALRALGYAEIDRRSIINSPLSIEYYTRARIAELFDEEGIPQPKTSVITLKRGEMPEGEFPLWLKRGDACAQELDDVCYAPDAEALAKALEGFRERGLDEIVVCEHVEGDLVKFYGVEGTDFFYHYYPTRDNDFSKFGFERYNGAPHDYAFSLKKLKEAADHAARKTSFYVYGGDCIVRPDGSFAIIDFNDWPSFSPCCENAAIAIAERILQMRPNVIIV